MIERARLGAVTVDCADPDRLAAFWGAVLGVEVAERLGDPPQYVSLQRAEGAPTVTFQRVPEPKKVKNRLHPDLEVDDVEAATARVERLGGRRVQHGDFDEHGYRWRVMADPEGNEFCLVFESPASPTGSP